MRGGGVAHGGTTTNSGGRRRRGKKRDTDGQEKNNNTHALHMAQTRGKTRRHARGWVAWVWNKKKREEEYGRRTEEGVKERRSDRKASDGAKGWVSMAGGE